MATFKSVFGTGSRVSMSGGYRGIVLSVTSTSVEAFYKVYFYSHDELHEKVVGSYLKEDTAGLDTTSNIS